MGFWGMLFNTSKLNSDPNQQELANLLIDAASGKKKDYDVMNFLVKQPWSLSEGGNRIVHALSMVKVRRPDLYPEAKRIGQIFYR